MGVCCDLEVDVNGEATFMVDKRIILSFSGRLRKLIRTTVDDTRCLKVVLHGIPGGYEGFEQIAKFCYNNGRVEITPTNVILLHYAADFLELEGCDGFRESQLMAETKRYLQGVNFWSWSELLVALKQCQICLSNKEDPFMIQKLLLNCLIGRLGLSSYESTCTSSSESSSFRYSSSDTRSRDSSTRNFTRSTWWFQDLVFLNIDMIEKLIETMISRNLDQKMISKFLFYYRKTRSSHSELAEKHKIIESVIDLLSLVDHSLLSCKGLFDIYQAGLRLKISRKSKHKLEVLMGSKLDELTVSDLLIPAPCGKDYVYDVNLVLRLVKFFKAEYKYCSPLCKFEKVGRLMDCYLMEVAPDSQLKASKFGALAMALPHSRRDSHDQLYQAIDMYLQVHVGLCEDEKTGVCSALNYNKLSAQALKDLTQNPKFPSKRELKSSLISKQNHSIELFCNSIFTKIL